jgi:hypothetical protein
MRDKIPHPSNPGQEKQKKQYGNKKTAGII